MAAKPNDFDLQLERLQEKEKIARVNNDHPASVIILKDIITLCYQAQQWDTLNDQVTFLMNRRGQSKKAQIEMIQLAMTWLANTKQPQRTRLIQTIRDVCAKKIFLEVQYARCVMLIVKGKQNQNDILQAAQILQQVQVQTYGSMDKRQKLEFILYQMRIMLKKHDYVRFYIISKKINENNINQAEIVDLKVTFYAYMAIYYNHQNEYAHACRAYRILHKTLQTSQKAIPEVLQFGFSARKEDVLSNYIGFLVLQSYSVKNHEELKELSERQQFQRHPYVLHIINKFLSEEIVSCDIGSYSPQVFELFRDSYENHKQHLDELKRMLVQHNVRIISKYYGQLTLNRVSQLLNIDRDYCEQQICSLNNAKTISCRIDRIDGVIDFRPVENEQYLLRNWNESINSILDLVDTTTNLIHREREVHKK